MKHKVSLIIPIGLFTEEQEKRTVESLSKLKDMNFELVLSYDGFSRSIDTQDLSEIYEIKQIINANTDGPSVARNLGVFASTGDIICYMDMGDEIDSERIGWIKEAFGSYPMMELAFCGYIQIHSQIDDNFINPYELFVKLSKNNSDVTKLLAYGGIVPPLGVAHKRKIFYHCGGFQPKIKSDEDAILWRRMASMLPVHSIACGDAVSGKHYFQDIERKFFDGIDVSDKEKYGNNGQGLDSDWFKYFNSERLGDGQ